VRSIPLGSECLGKREESLVTTKELLSLISLDNDKIRKLGNWLFWSAIFVATLAASPQAKAAIQCDKTITANVVVFDSPTVFNRLGAQNPNWITYALKRDAVNKSGDVPCSMSGGNHCTKGNVELRGDKRPRPLVIRSVAGACLTVTLTNLLTDVANPNNEQQGPPGVLINNDQVAGRCAGFHASGTELRDVPGPSGDAMDNDASMVGTNPGADIEPTNAGQPNCGPGLAAPGETRTYHLYTPHEGAFVINSYGATLGSEGNAGNLGIGMFGALNVQPKGARIYRSQVTEEEMRLATTGYTALGQPEIDYEKKYPTNAPWSDEGKADLPIINMLAGPGCDSAGWTNCELVHSDINAIIAGPDDDGTWYSKCPNGADEECPYPLESVGKKNPQLPQRLEAFREFTSIFHDEQTNTQVFPKWYNDAVMGHVTAGVRDAFMINYGSGGIGSEIIANRLHTGPMHDCTDCAYEEFFLSSLTVGDPAMLVNFPANTGIEACDPAVIAGLNGGQAQATECWRDPVNLRNGPVATFDQTTGELIAMADNYALYQEDPGNIHHAYTGDFVKYRNTHAGAFEQHIFHFHNHQWLFNPNDDNANYLDAQEIMPGSGHTYELVNGGAGNRNHTVGDAIFHCHFYPHFAQGMWYHQRNHDVFETGTVLAMSEANDPQRPALFDDLNKQANFHKSKFGLRSGKPAAGSRALPDAELPDGSPIPAVIPLPGKPMPHMPAHVEVRPVDRGAHSLLGGRLPPDGIPDSSQAIVDRASTVDADGNLVSPGYPFWLAGNECGDIPFPAPGLLVGDECPQGIVGQRMATPPLDMLTAEGAAAISPHKMDPSATDWTNLGGGWDGGLPRHALLGYVSTGLSKDTNSRLDFRKIIEMAKPVYFPEIGTDLEQVSMAYQAVRHRDSFANTFNTVIETPVVEVNGIEQGGWVLNGAPPVPGGPYNDPCVDDNGIVLKGGHTGSWYSGDDLTRWTTMNVRGKSPFDAEHPRTYNIANLQIDAVFNKVGYHYAQERIIILWQDVAPTIFKDRPVEPLVMRFNTFDCGKLRHANLVPHEMELDDFQVRTPTDIIGQHIHLPKWDLTTNDGAANGWNYEDGALAPGIVVERIHAINRFNGLVKLGAACAADPNSNETFVDFDGSIFNCTNFEGNAVLVKGSLPGQLSPIDLSDQVQVPTIDTGDPFGTPKDLLHLEAAAHPFFDMGGDAFGGQNYAGARTVIQRILVDPVVNVAGVDRGLGLTFSHDHYGPSTFQQIGLYSTILAEPAGSKWVHNESGETLGGQTPADIDGPRNDGGPTSWQAAILTGEVGGYNDNVGGADVPAHREFYFEMSDFQHAYEAGVYVGANDKGVPKLTNIIQPDPFDATRATAPDIQQKWLQAVNPTLKLTANGGMNPGAFPDTVNAHPGCPGPGTGPTGPGHPTQNDPDVPRPCAEAINIGHSSMWVVNYRNEPIGLRVFDPNEPGPDNNRNGRQTRGPAGDLALAFESRQDRAISDLNSSFGNTPYPQASYCNGKGDGVNCDRRGGDPFTPTMRAYMNDEVKIKIQVGATEEQHQTTVHGMKWLSNGSGFGRSGNSGWRNFQSHGISEQFSLQVPITQDPDQPNTTVDYLYATDATRDGIWSGTWGLLRAYQSRQSDLIELPNNPQRGGFRAVNEDEFVGICPAAVDNRGRFTNTPANLRQFNVYAVLANDVLGNVIDVDGTNGPDITIPDNNNPVDNVGGPLNPLGGTLVYNRRGTVVPDRTIVEGEELVSFEGGEGPLNDPTAMMYVLEEDLQPRGGYGADGYAVDDRCLEAIGDGSAVRNNLRLEGCPVQLAPDVPVEPLVLRANAGDCIEVNLFNKFLDQAELHDGDDYEPAYAYKYTCTAYDLNNQCIDGYEEWEPVFEDFEVEESLAKGFSLRTKSGAETYDVNDVKLKFDSVPDLAGWQDTFWVVNRDLFKPVADRNQVQMSFFGNNLIAPSARAGLVAQLVDYDSRINQGIEVGMNNQETTAKPGGAQTYQYYAGDVSTNVVGQQGNRTLVEFVATPVEFGGSNLLSADRVKQPQKGLFGALVIEPEGATWTEDTVVADGQGMEDALRPTRAQVTVIADPGPAGSGGTYRETVAIAHKIANLRWADGSAIRNVNQPEFGVEGAEDSGHAGFNYGMEPSWFRFKLPPDVPFGAAKKDGNGDPENDFTYGSIPNPQAMYANELVAAEPNAIEDVPSGCSADGDPSDCVTAAGDPQTPVFRAIADPDGANPVLDTRMFVLNGASADRDSTYILHGHVWQRDPHVCTGDKSDLSDRTRQDASVPIEGRCDPRAEVPSNALGLNKQAKYMGGEEGMGHVFGHWPILVDAGGTDAVTGDYLYRDYAPNGNRNGMFGILRVANVGPQEPPATQDPPAPPPAPEQCQWDPTILASDPACAECEWVPGISAGSAECVEPAPEQCPWEPSITTADPDCEECPWADGIWVNDPACVKPEKPCKGKKCR
jgi:hypothetical protein